jgi:hypothetical protein
MEIPQRGLRNEACGASAAGETLRNEAWRAVSCFLFNARDQLYAIPKMYKSKLLLIPMFTHSFSKR